jgi:RsiW-degrading membrane proteinase PrsW (M82 family)
MLPTINRVFLALILIAASLAIVVSVLTLFLPLLFGGDAELEATASMKNRSDFSIHAGPVAFEAADSPQVMNISVSTPPLSEGDLLFIDVYNAGRQLGHADCLENLGIKPVGMTSFVCQAPIPYDYLSSGNYSIFAVLTSGGAEYSAGPVRVGVDWARYELDFQGLSWLIAVIIAAIYLLVVLPAGLMMWAVASGTKHVQAEYTLGSLAVLTGKGALQKFRSFLVSPYFWAVESAGIFVILLYLAATAQVWKSWSAMVAFVFSGLLSFIVPFLWCASWWYADYREREPLRIIVSFFLWGMLACLMAIGLNSIAGALFGVVGLGFFSAFLLAPPLEEFFKGSGLALLSEHREYDSIEDGIVFGFTVGMGFSFIENWVYLIDNPMGSDIWGWLWVFLLRSVLLSANHGFFTALTGIAIGYLVERGFRAPALGLLIGFPVAAFFHAMHNSGEAIMALLGGGGALIYCCFLIPLFDYGGLIVLVLLFIRSVLRKKGSGRP